MTGTAREVPATRYKSDPSLCISVLVDGKRNRADPPSAIDRAIVLAIGLIQRNPTLSLSVRLLCHPEVFERSGALKAYRFRMQAGEHPGEASAGSTANRSPGVRYSHVWAAWRGNISLCPRL